MVFSKKLLKIDQKSRILRIPRMSQGLKVSWSHGLMVSWSQGLKVSRYLGDGAVGGDRGDRDEGECDL